MIGRWLALLTEQEEDNLLTTKLVPFLAHVREQEDQGCLVGVALKHASWGMRVGPRQELLWQWWNGTVRPPLRLDRNIACRFNALCQKLVGVPVRERRASGSYQGTPAQLEGGARAAALIRARILRHRAQRALRAAPACADAMAGIA